MNQKEMNRKEIQRALAKALAYKKSGRQALAEAWTETLVQLLECTNILANK